MKSTFHLSCRHLVLGLSIVAVGCLMATNAMSQVLQPPVITAIDGQAVPPPPVAGGVPMGWDDPVFSSVVNSGGESLGSGQSVSNKSITTSSGDAAIYCAGACNVSYVRIRAREGYRCSQGAQNLTWIYMEITASAPDHGDGIQCYLPGATGTVTLKNSTIRVSGSGINGNYFAADDWRGSHILENVLFWSGNSCFFVPGDGGSSISLTNVYFVQGTCSTPIRIDTVGGKRPTIVKWENVRYVTVVNGKLVMGAAIPKPY
jgi:hypothetical protein